MRIKLLDGLDNVVAHTTEDIKRALERTDIVQDQEGIITLSRFYNSVDGDEIDVYDSRRNPGDCQTIYEPEEVDHAIAEFRELLATL